MSENITLSQVRSNSRNFGAQMGERVFVVGLDQNVHPKLKYICTLTLMCVYVDVCIDVYNLKFMPMNLPMSIQGDFQKLFPYFLALKFEK